MKYIGKEIRRTRIKLKGKPLIVTGSYINIDRGADSGSTAIYTNNIQN